jgi:hypothetical protein
MLMCNCSSRPTPQAGLELQFLLTILDAPSITDSAHYFTCTAVLYFQQLNRYCFVTNSMEQSPSWGPNNRSASQEILCLLWNLKVHYCVHKSLSLSPILIQMNPVHTLPSYFSKIHSNFILLSTPKSSKCLFPSAFPTKFFTHFSSLLCVLHAISSSLIWSS